MATPELPVAAAMASSPRVLPGGLADNENTAVETPGASPQRDGHRRDLPATGGAVVARPGVGGEELLVLQGASTTAAAAP
jgi:hypothetical protein